MKHALFFLLALLSATAYAHKPSDSYLALSVTGQDVTGRWDIALRDLDYAIGLDRDDDGAITWGEVRARHNEIAAYALAHLRISTGDVACATQPVFQQIDSHSDGAYSVLDFRARCHSEPQLLEIGYRLFAEIDPQHRGLLRLASGDTTQSAILGPAQPQEQFALGAENRLGQFVDYFRDGARHIWIGYDHILFLIALLLPSVLQRRNGRWYGVGDARTAVTDTLKIVTAFTLAHSITLSLAALDVVHLPARLVESAIAASVVLAAVDNLYPRFHRHRWQMAFLFGLMHGFGFAAVLGDLGLAPSARALSLAAFNLGVEAGQLAIVAIFLPLALWARHTWFYARPVMMAGSWSVAVVAGLWLTQRVFKLQLIPG
ncbi:MAG: lnt [Gammaproteobacteria bacterium]|nr:MAG: lnt [Gammaproteobacteria bacterium]TND07122.1 MAG: lnt [Gammaproteobacteria bacterium]